MDLPSKPKDGSLHSVQGAAQPERRRLGVGGELTLALLPTATMLAVFFFVEVFSRQQLLFASLASSAFLIYLDPRHATNRVRTLVVAQGGGALLGFLAHSALGGGYAAVALAMVATIVLMIVADAVHPPAVSTSLGFAFRTGPESNLALFGAALFLVAVLIVLARLSLRVLEHLEPPTEPR